MPIKKCKECKQSNVEFYGRDCICKKCKNKIKKFEYTKMINKTDRIIFHLEGFKAYLLDKKIDKKKS